MMNEHAQGLRKAAILVAALDRATADTLLDAMRPEQAALVRQTVVTMDPVDPAEERRVIDEFLRQGLPSPPREPAGIELDGRLAQRLAERKAPMNDLPVGG
ncbi:MAG: hypothetical protein JW818_15355, partial [Pirellulales bacterium]|nr:hypothetical protein [Pirellulales bacterium]